MIDSMSTSSISEDEKDLQPIKRIKKTQKKDEIRVFLRIRPQDNLDKKGPIGVNDEERCLQGVSNDDYLNQKIDEFRGLQFNKIFKEDCSQDEFYQEVIAPILPDIFHNQKSSVIFAYGVTNSGKTHSIIGQKSWKNQSGDGILPRILHFLVETKRQIKQQLQQKVDFNFDIPFKSNENKIYDTLNIDGVQIDLNNFINQHHHNTLLKLSDISIYFENFEIYNEEIFDLQTVQQSSQPQGMHLNNFQNNLYSQSQTLDLKKEKRSASKRNTSQKSKLKIKEKYNKKVYIKDLVTNEIEKSEQINWFIKNTIENRQVNNNNINQSSSRSQCCFKIRVRFNYTNAFHTQEIKEASLLILDLAGAERAKKTNNTGSKMAESCHINKTLLCLGNCIRALRNGDENIPYRDSKLTRILNEYFQDQNNVLMIVHIHPGINYTEENINVLKYAAMGLEAKLKSAPIYEGQSKYSYLMDSAQKYYRNDKSYASNISYDQRNLYRDYQSMDQDQLFAQIDNIIYNGAIQNDIYGNKNMQNENQQIHDNINDCQMYFNGIQNDSQNRAFEEQQKQLENKFRELELREIILMQKRSIENFDLQFESLLNEEQNKLKVGQSLLNQFKIPDQIMYGYLTEDEVNQKHLQSIKKDEFQSEQDEKREMVRVSDKYLSRYSQKSQPQQKIIQVGGGYRNSSQKDDNSSKQMKESVKSNLTENTWDSNNQSDNCQINQKYSVNSQKNNQEHSVIDQQSIFKEHTPNSILSDKENYLQISNPQSRNQSTSSKQIENYNIHSPLKSIKINSQQIILSQKTDIDKIIGRTSLDVQLQSQRKSIMSKSQNSQKESNSSQVNQTQLSQNTIPDQNIQQNQKRMDAENEGLDKNIIFNNKNNKMIPDNKIMINELNEKNQEEQQNLKCNFTSSNKKMNEEKEIMSDQKKRMINENEQVINDINSVLVKSGNVQKQIEQIYESSTKKEQTELTIDKGDQSSQLLESMNIYEGSDDDESEGNKTAPNSINSMVNLDEKKLSQASNMTSVSQILMKLNQQQDQERQNMQRKLQNGEEQIKQQLEIDYNEQQLKKQILNQSETLMKLIKDNKEISLQMKYFEIQRDNKQKEDERKMKEFEKWITQIQSEIVVQQRLLEQKEAIICQYQLELATLQSNLEEKQRIQQEQITQSLLASEAMKLQMKEQEQKLQEEVERTTKLQEKLTEEMQELMREKTNLGLQKNKKNEMIKSLQATAQKQNPQNKQMEVEPNYNDSNQINQDNLICYNSTQQPNQINGNTYSNTPKKNSHNDKGFNNINGKSYAEKQIQTSVYRSTKPYQNNSNNNNHIIQHSDASAYTYYSYGEAEQFPQSQTNNMNLSQGNTQNSQSQSSNVVINTSNKNKLKSNASQPKTKIHIGIQSIPQQQSKNDQNISQNTQSNSQEMKDEDQNKKNLENQKSNQVDQSINKEDNNSNQKKISENQSMVDEKDEILNDQQQANENTSQNEEEDEEKNNESKRQRGRRKNNKQPKKQRKATSKDKNQETSVDSSTSKESNTNNDLEIAGKNNSDEIISNEEIENTLEMHESSKNNRTRGKSKLQRESVSSNRSASRNSTSSIKSDTSANGSKQQNTKKQKGKGQKQKKYELEQEEVSEEETKNSKTEQSKKQSTNYNKKKTKNRK